MLNHVPVIGVLFTLCVFAYGCIKKNSDFQRFSLGAYAGLAFITIVVFMTGGAVGRLFEALPGVPEEVLAPHQQAATLALIAMELLGMAGLYGLIVFRGKSTYPSSFLALVAGLSTATMLLMAWTAHTGTYIRHIELFVASHLVVPPEGIPPYNPSDNTERER